MSIGLGDEIALDNARGGPLDRKVRFGCDRLVAIERTAEGIDDAAEQTRPDRHPHDLARPSDPRAGFDGIAFVEQHRADRFGVERERKAEPSSFEAAEAR